jgi:hypothetical protein
LRALLRKLRLQDTLALRALDDLAASGLGGSSRPTSCDSCAAADFGLQARHVSAEARDFVLEELERRRVGGPRGVARPRHLRLKGRGAHLHGRQLILHRCQETLAELCALAAG